MLPSVCPPWPTDGPGQTARERNEAAGSYTTAGDTIQSLDPHRHIAEQRAECHGVMALTGQPAPARRTAAALTHRGHLRRNDLGLKRRGQPLRFGEPKPQVSQAGLLVALDADHLSLRHNARPKLRHQLHPPHQIRHQTHPFAVSLEPSGHLPHPRIFNALELGLRLSDCRQHSARRQRRFVDRGAQGA